MKIHQDISQDIRIIISRSFLSELVSGAHSVTRVVIFLAILRAIRNEIKPLSVFANPSAQAEATSNKQIQQATRTRINKYPRRFSKSNLSKTKACAKKILFHIFHWFLHVGSSPFQFYYEINRTMALHSAQTVRFCQFSLANGFRFVIANLVRQIQLVTLVQLTWKVLRPCEWGSETTVAKVLWYLPIEAYVDTWADIYVAQPYITSHEEVESLFGWFLLRVAFIILRLGPSAMWNVIHGFLYVRIKFALIRYEKDTQYYHLGIYVKCAWNLEEVWIQPTKSI